MLVRHARPERHDDDGTEADPGLTPAGRAQAAAVARRLAGERPDALYASTMARAVQTARPLADATGLDLRTDEDLCEFDRGVPTYVPLEEVGADREQQWQELLQGWWGGRRFDLHAFRDRVVARLDAVVAEHAGQSVVVVAHGGVVNAYASAVLGLPAPFFFSPEYTGITRVRVSRGGHRELAVLNDSCHLPVSSTAPTG